ncbi:MAG TPA: DUF3854 domain-containing protein [Mycobacterium sp.]|nr:DUF3854 domain-containing protein [Mycobacterium sp.]
MISPGHLAMLTASGITPEHVALRGYETVTDRGQLATLKIAKDGRNVPGLLVPQLRNDGSTWGYQYRPDIPRLRNGKPIKYETPWQQSNGLDIPPGVADRLGDPDVPLWITEGVKKADCGALHGLCIVALSGVWNWLGTNRAGGKMAIPDWNDTALNNRRVILAFDGDVARKESVQKSLHALAKYLAYKGSRVYYLHLPDSYDKTGLDDYLMAGHTVEDLWRLVKPTAPPPRQDGDDTRADRQRPGDPKPDPATPVSLDDALAVFGRWLHIDDSAPVIVTAATVVANLTEGDPVWTLLVGPPSGGKTEILSSLLGLPYIVPTATITEAALLSGSPQRERTKDATGGLMRQIGDFGILLAKDFTSVLSQNYDTAKRAMSALREIYDGRWDRPVGTDGAKVLHWHGKCGFVGGVTPSYDRYYSIVNTLGDRYALLRMPEVDPAKQARAALAQAEHEKQMRAELAEAMTGLIASADQTLIHTPLDEQCTIRLVRLATFAVRTRTGIDRDGYTGDLQVIPQVEGPARLIKALRRLYGALLSIGVDTDTCWTVVTRIAIDCAPGMRVPYMQLLLSNNADTWQRTAEIAENVGMVTKTASRALDDLMLLGIVDRRKESKATNAPHLWRASNWLREHWPLEVRLKSTTTCGDPSKEGSEDDQQPLPVDRFLSYSDHGGDGVGADGQQITVKSTNAEGNTAYRNGVCIDCKAKPASAGRPRCDECHAIHVRVMAGYDS